MGIRSAEAAKSVWRVLSAIKHAAAESFADNAVPTQTPLASCRASGDVRKHVRIQQCFRRARGRHSQWTHWTGPGTRPVCARGRRSRWTHRTGPGTDPVYARDRHCRWTHRTGPEPKPVCARDKQCRSITISRSNKVTAKQCHRFDWHEECMSVRFIMPAAMCTLLRPLSIKVVMKKCMALEHGCLRDGRR